MTCYDLEVESVSNTDSKADHNKPVAASSEEQDMERVNFLTSRYGRLRRIPSKDLLS